MQNYFLKIMLPAVLGLSSSYALALSCTDHGNTDTTDTGMLSANRNYAYGVTFPGGNWKINSLSIRTKKGAGNDTRTIASWDGSAYTFPASPNASNESLFGAAANYFPFNLVADSDNIAHLVIAVSGIQYFKGKTASIASDSTSGAWDTTEIDTTTPTSVALSIDKSVTPNRLYLFYHVGTDAYLRWRYLDVNASGSSWSAVLISGTREITTSIGFSLDTSPCSVASPSCTRIKPTSRSRPLSSDLNPGVISHLSKARGVPLHGKVDKAKGQVIAEFTALHHARSPLGLQRSRDLTRND